MMRQKICLVAIVAFIVTGLAWWFRSKPTAKVIPVGTVTLPKPIEVSWVLKQGDRHTLILVTKDNRGWQVTIQDGKLVHRPTQIPEKFNFPDEVRWGFFDMDKDGFNEFFKVEPSTPIVLWVFKRCESVKGQTVKPQPLPSWFNLSDRSRWVVWAKISWKRRHEYDGYDATFAFVTDPDPNQPRKVIVWVEQDCAGGIGSFFVLSPDGQRLIPFEPEDLLDFYRGIDMIKDLDGDGICEIVVNGTVFKWNGRTYQRWWPSPLKDEHVLLSDLCDFDGDGVEEGVAILSSKRDKQIRVLAIYQLEEGRYRKIVQCTLPRETRDDFPRLRYLKASRKGGIIVLERESQLLFYLYRQRELYLAKAIEWNNRALDWVTTGSDEQVLDIFVGYWHSLRWLDKFVSFLPFQLQDWVWRTFMRVRGKTLILSFDGEQIRIRQVWQGRLEDVGKVGNKAWGLISVEPLKRRTPYHCYLLFGANGRYRVIWQENLPKTLGNRYDCAADLDGDGDDEMVLCVGRKVHVFKIVPNRKPKGVKI